MQDQQLRDKNGKLMGTIKTLANGKMEIRDHTGRCKGTFDPKTNETRDPNNKVVGRGNFLSTLL